MKRREFLEAGMAAGAGALLLRRNAGAAAPAPESLNVALIGRAIRGGC